MLLTQHGEDSGRRQQRTLRSLRHLGIGRAGKPANDRDLGESLPGARHVQRVLLAARADSVDTDNATTDAVDARTGIVLPEHQRASRKSHPARQVHQPAPMPQSSRPPLMTSMVLVILASTDGSR